MKESLFNKLTFLALLLLGGALLITGIGFFKNRSDVTSEKAHLPLVHKTDSTSPIIMKPSNDSPSMDSLQMVVQVLQTENEKILQENQYLEQQVESLSQQTIQVSNTEPPVNNAQPSFRLESFSIESRCFENNREVTNNEANKVEKFSGKILFKNPDPAAEINEFILVVNRPNGLVLNIGWESGTFDIGEGEKAFTKKIRVDQRAGELQTVFFEVIANRFEYGYYTFKLFHEGKMIDKKYLQLY